MNTYLTVSSLLNLIAALLLVTFILSSRDRNPVRRRYLYFLFSITGWAASYFLWRVSSVEAYAELFCKILISASIFSVITFYHFCLALAGVKSPRSVIVGYSVACAFVCLVPFDLMVDGVSAKFGHEYWPDAGPFMFLYIVYFFCYLVVGGGVLLKGWQQHIGGRASDILFVFYSGIVGFIGGSTNFPLWYDIPIQPYGNVLVAIYIFLVGYGLYSNRIAGISMDVYKAGVGLLLNISVALFYLLFLGLYRSVVGAELEAFQLWSHGIAAFLGSALVFWGVPRLKTRTEKILEGVFRKDRVSALSELKSLPTQLSDLVEEEAISKATGKAIMHSLDVSGVAIFTLETFDSQYRCGYSIGEFKQSPKTFEIESDSPIIEGLCREPECLILDQIYDDLDKYYYRALVELRNQLDVSVIVPIFVNHEVYGLILIGHSGQPRVWTEEEASILFNIGAQIGINLRTRDFERRASEVDKLVALGTMAAGLAHEIRNPLVSVQTLASLVKSGKSLDRMPENFKGVLLRDVKRIASIVEGVSLYSQNQQGKKEPVAINQVLEGSLEINQKLADDLGVEVEFSREDGAEVLVRANLEQLIQVFNNLIENAIHSVEEVEDPKVTLSITKKTVRGARSQSWVELSVADNGAGIPKAIIGRIFDPFITSKDTGSRDEQKGMGLGLAISKRIVENHSGAISVQNIPSGGAKFVVSLKCME